MHKLLPCVQRQCVGSLSISAYGNGRPTPNPAFNHLLVLKDASHLPTQVHVGCGCDKPASIYWPVQTTTLLVHTTIWLGGENFGHSEPYTYWFTTCFHACVEATHQTNIFTKDICIHFTSLAQSKTTCIHIAIVYLSHIPYTSLTCIYIGYRQLAQRRLSAPPLGKYTSGDHLLSQFSRAWYSWEHDPYVSWAITPRPTVGRKSQRHEGMHETRHCTMGCITLSQGSWILVQDYTHNTSDAEEQVATTL